MIRRSTCGVAVCLVVLASLAAPLDAAQDSLATARALYTSAEYEAALVALNQMRATGLVAEDVPRVEQYRALCLLALGRATEAEDAMAAAVAAVPSFSPSGNDVSPRVKSAFVEVRRRVLPTIIQQTYGEAKTAFDRKDYVAAGEGFTQVLNVLDDADLASIASQPPLVDLRTLAKGFRDLSVNAAAMTPPAPPAAPSAPVPALAAAPVPIRIYTLADANVIAPVIVRQALPPFPRKPLAPHQGALEVVIDEHGVVEAAVIRAPIDQVYDSIALAASRNWRYQPAMRDGTPVKFRKLVQVKIQP